MRTLVMAALVVAASGGAATAQDVAKGETSFKKCLPCHSVGPGARNKIGPVLNGLDGRKAGTVPAFSYSEANKNSGLVWNDEVFSDYIKDPRAKMPGTKMIFAGVRNENEIKDLWAYIKQFDEQGNVKK
jgi:cytochrome c